MADADFDLIFAMRSALLSDPTVRNYIGTRFYDPPPQSNAEVVSPYISLGPSTSIPDDYDCIDGEEITVQFDVWTWGAGTQHSSVMCRRICNAIRAVLHEAELSLANSALASCRHELTRITRDPDGIHNHGVVQFTATVELPGG